VSLEAEESHRSYLKGQLHLRAKRTLALHRFFCAASWKVCVTMHEDIAQLTKIVT
jgi:hypothetical protein